MAKVSKAELIKILEGTGDNELIDIDELSNKIKAKIHPKGDTIGETLDNNKQDSGKIVRSEFDAEMDSIRSCAGATSPALESLDVFSKQNDEAHTHTIGKGKVTTHSAEEAIQTLLSHGIREENYAKVRLGLLSYSDYLATKPELLRHKRASTVCKNLFGYNGFGQSPNRKSKVAILSHILLKISGRNKDFNVWLKELKFVKRPDPKSGFAGLSFEQYLDNAVKYIDDYFDAKFSNCTGIIENPNDVERFVQKAILTMVDLGYNCNQILYAILRKTHTPRGYKRYLLKDWFRSFEGSVYIKTVSNALFSIWDKPGNDLNKETMDILLDVAHLIDSLENGDIRVGNLELEELVCPNCKEIGELKCKLNIIHRLVFLRGVMEYQTRVDGEFFNKEAEERFTKDLTKTLVKYGEVFNSTDLEDKIKQKYTLDDLNEIARFIQENYYCEGGDERKLPQQYRLAYVNAVRSLPARRVPHNNYSMNDNARIVQETVWKFKYKDNM